MTAVPICPYCKRSINEDHKKYCFFYQETSIERLERIRKARQFLQSDIDRIIKKAQRYLD